MLISFREERSWTYSYGFQSIMDSTEQGQRAFHQAGTWIVSHIAHTVKSGSSKYAWHAYLCSDRGLRTHTARMDALLAQRSLQKGAAHLVEGGVAVGAVVGAAASALLFLRFPLPVLTPCLLVLKLVHHRLDHHHHDALQGMHHFLIPLNPRYT